MPVDLVEPVKIVEIVEYLSEYLLYLTQKDVLSYHHFNCT
jgi:hypothetical protein